MGPLGPMPKMSSGTNNSNAGKSFLDYVKMGENYGTGPSSSGSGFSGAFSKDFGKGFLDFYKAGMLERQGSGDNEGSNPFFSGSSGGASITKIPGSESSSIYTFPTEKPIVQASQPSQPGFLENVATAAVPALIGAWCDERLKVDMAPLESTEVNDALAEIAFFVKGLRECA
jgi:hypothetical protein